ncbi:MAG: 30S ribosomal protein S1 [Saprospiraceae bacterium]|nr:30S ribosomal protein S1 [Saprospiraceae bacterium]
MIEDQGLEQDHKDEIVADVEDIADIQLEPVQESLSAAHDDFDWTIGKRNTVKYDDSEHKKYFEQYDNSLNSVSELEVVKGRVTAIHSGDVVLDINYKSDGLVSLSEFRDTPDLKIGDYVDVYVENKEDIRGQLILSRRKAKLLKAWDNLVESYKNGTIIKGLVVSKTKGGLIVDCLGLETFLPGSQIDVKPIIDYDVYVGKTMEFKVVKVNEAIKNAVVSHKALIESDLAEQRETIISGLEKGQVLEGVVKNITDFGAFMDLGGVDGLLYITDISWGRINHPNEVLSLNQKINVVVLDFGEDKKRISLGLKQLTPHPWEVLDNTIAEGSTITGKIVNIEDYGAFLEIIPGVEGLIHVSEVNWSSQPVNARDYFTLGQELQAKVVTIDRDERKMSLSIKQLTEDPWSIVSAKYKVGTQHVGEVKTLTPYGVFVELENGIGGMVHISDLSWTKRYSHPSEFTKVGEKIDVSILEVDEETRKLSLGHKQLEENPWDTFENVFPVGSYHEATIVKKDDRGAVVQLPYGLEAYAPLKHIKKEDGSTAGNEETLTFKVIEFNRDDNRIIVSHSRYLEDIKKEADQLVDAEKNKERDEVKKTIKATQSKVELSTFGDIAGFSELKEQMAATKTAESAPKKAEEVKADAPVEVPVEATIEAPVEATVEAPLDAVIEAPAVVQVEEEVIEVVPEVKAEPQKKSAKGDDLKKIEGIGPKIEELLHIANIVTFSDLAKADVAVLKEILHAAGSRYQMHDPSSWPMQSEMAANGDWDKLKEWQENAKGGKIED